MTDKHNGMLLSITDIPLDKAPAFACAMQGHFPMLGQWCNM